MDRIRSCIEIKGSLGLIGVCFAGVCCHLVNDAHRIQIKARASKWGRPGVVDNSVFAVALRVEGVDASYHVYNSDIANFVDANVAHHGQIF